MTRTATWTVLLAACVLLTAGCARRPRVPDIAGPLLGVVVSASFEGERTGLPGGPLLLDSVSFALLGVAAGGGAFSAAELRAGMDRPYELSDAQAVLECPRREPCRVRGDATWLEVWEATRTGDTMEVVVSRVFNVQGLHRMTSSVTHRLRLASAAGGWRLIARERLPR